MTRALLIGLIRVYQRVVSPSLPVACRFTPSCSEYAAQAIRKHGPWKGGWLAAKRLSRCRPGGGGGEDPVP